MSACCGRGSVESLMAKFQIVNATYNTKQHPHSNNTAPALTTQKTNPFVNSNVSNNTILTQSGYVKYIKPLLKSEQN